MEDRIKPGKAKQQTEEKKRSGLKRSQCNCVTDGAEAGEWKRKNSGQNRGTRPQDCEEGELKAL